jgi:CheY-like chemotaxis protein
LVEDNDINREFATELLRSEGIEVDEAENGAIAVAKMQEQDYDAVLMDIQMPVMDGLEAARRIRALGRQARGERLAQLPIIAMTALAMSQDAEKSQAAGMNDHVTKPIAPDRLMAALVKWVRLPDERRATARAATVTAPADDIPPELLALESLDVREGVRRIGGKAAAYRKQLRRFREHYPDAVAELRRLIELQGTQRAEDYCHTLKGVCGNLGARVLYERITAIDNTLKRGETPAPAALDEAQALLAQTLREIDGLAASTPETTPPAATPLSTEAMHALLARLSHALEYDLGAAESLLSELRAGVAGTSREASVNAIATLVDTFDIDAALLQLKQLEAPLPGKTP